VPFLTGPALYLIVALLCTNGIAGVMWFVKNAEAKRTQAELATSQAQYTAFADQVRAQGEIAIEKAKATVAEQKRITERVADDYETRLAALRADYERLHRLARARPAGSGVPALPDAAARADAIPADALPLAAQCAETTLTLVSLQEWLKEIEK
jgi:hypothetical protein